MKSLMNHSIIFQFLCGAAGSTALSNVAGTIADLFGDADNAGVCDIYGNKPDSTYNLKVNPWHYLLPVPILAQALVAQWVNGLLIIQTWVSTGSGGSSMFS